MQCYHSNLLHKTKSFWSWGVWQFLNIIRRCQVTFTDNDSPAMEELEYICPPIYRSVSSLHQLASLRHFHKLTGAVSGAKTFARDHPVLTTAAVMCSCCSVGLPLLLLLAFALLCLLTGAVLSPTQRSALDLGRSDASPLVFPRHTFDTGLPAFSAARKLGKESTGNSFGPVVIFIPKRDWCTGVDWQTYGPQLPSADLWTVRL